MMNLPIDVLYQDTHWLVVQTRAGAFDKWANSDCYGEFNMGLHVADTPKTVLQNRAKLLEFLAQLSGQRVKALHWLDQIHSNIVINPQTLQPTANKADALISTQIGAGLAIMTADCVPIAILGENSVACIHAGHQGLTSGVIANTIHALKTKAPLQAVIGACISQQNYQISNELARAIIQKVSDQHLTAPTKDELYQAVIKPCTEDKCFLDVVALTKLQLEHLGVTVLSQDVPCSYAKPNLYSYRAQTHANKPATGRMAMVVARLC